MANSTKLAQHRYVLGVLEGELAQIERDVPPLAAQQLAKARAMVRGADSMIRAALRNPVDVVIIDLVPQPVGGRR